MNFLTLSKNATSSAEARVAGWLARAEGASVSECEGESALGRDFCLSERGRVGGGVRKEMWDATRGGGAAGAAGEGWALLMISSRLQDGGKGKGNAPRSSHRLCLRLAHIGCRIRGKGSMQGER